MDHKVLDFPRMIANLERMNMRQEDHEKGQSTNLWAQIITVGKSVLGARLDGISR